MLIAFSEFRGFNKPRRHELGVNLRIMSGLLHKRCQVRIFLLPGGPREGEISKRTSVNRSWGVRRW